MWNRGNVWKKRNEGKNREQERGGGGGESVTHSVREGEGGREGKGGKKGGRGKGKVRASECECYSERSVGHQTDRQKQMQGEVNE